MLEPGTGLVRHRLKKNRLLLLLTSASLLLLACTGCGDKGSASLESPTPPHEADPDATPVAAVIEPVSFNADIRPLLSDKCFFCHGPDPKTREADLRLDIEQAAHADLGGYAAIVPGNREASELWIRINDSADPMPPIKSHKELSPDEVALIGRWIDEGGAYETHWAYVPPTRPEVPKVSDPAWAKSPIDNFILARLDARSIRPSPQADKRTLMRRVTLDLTGLPPTPEQASAFMNDSSPDAYEKYVDSLLASPSYGEHLAVWWLDLVRYADSIGFHSDNGWPAWPYREWVIRALSDNLPFDQFTIMQLAGDQMLEAPTRDMLIASAYNRLSPLTEEGGAQPKEYRAIQNADRVTNYGEVWLGSSTGCSQCHDHKFDPFTQEDFYSLAAFFGSLNGADISWEKYYAHFRPPITFVAQNPEQGEQIKAHEAKYAAFLREHPAAIRVEDREANRDPRPALPSDEELSPEHRKTFLDILKEREKLAQTVPVVMVSRELDVPRTVRILARGNWQDDSGKIVLPATPAFLGGPASTEERRLTRLDLAQWTVSKDNPLTARAITNRLWARYLGSPLSSNTLDLGSQGSLPTHPMLLDWMAVEFRESGWDLRHMIRLIVTSETYKQSSDTRSELAQIDPSNNKLFARQSAMRLPAEVLRDQALEVSGLLAGDRVGGPSVFPYQPEGHWEPLNFPKRSWPTSEGADLYRRSMYTWAQRTFPHPMMTTFDAPSRESCTGQRMVSTTPLQALASLNGPVFVESARVLASHLLKKTDDDDARLKLLFQKTLAREPRESEHATLIALLASQRAIFKASPEDAKKLVAIGEAPTPEDVDAAEHAAWTGVCRVVLNLHETLTRN